ncbi:MAG: MaoC/PaaZ C-terminal domain-containing protein [Thermaerobacter sp.]|nr:MaoC/PaaZ C-terminal domain-containing protein [Thermaerobacter sp.]
MNTGDEFGPYPVIVTREQLVRYAGASDDYNPIHYDDELARSLGLPGVIVHGMLAMGLMVRLVTENVPDLGGVEKFNVRFRQMIQPGQPLVITARVKGVDSGTADLDVQLAVEGQRPAVTGKMRVRLKSL